LLTKSEDRLVEVAFNDRFCLKNEVFSCRADEDGGKKDESLEWFEVDALCKTAQVEGAERLALAAVNALLESVGEERVACKTLGLLCEESEGEGVCLLKVCGVGVGVGSVLRLDD
jgi:hypothetical protein